MLVDLAAWESPEATCRFLKVWGSCFGVLQSGFWSLVVHMKDACSLRSCHVGVLQRRTTLETQWIYCSSRDFFFVTPACYNISCTERVFHVCIARSWRGLSSTIEGQKGAVWETPTVAELGAALAAEKHSHV